MTGRTKATIIGSVAVIGVAAAAIGTWLVIDAPDSQAKPEPITLTLEVKNDHVAKHDFGKPGMDVGDMDIFSDILSVNGKQVGYDGGACFFTNVTPEKPMTYCELTIQLDEGQIFARSLTPHTLAPFTMAITGGTGEYADARGELTVSGVATPDEKYELKLTK
ncbi:MULTISPECIES: allene oxide cyclase barrel-like domain-containing protein [Mycolicibacterium]|uniref:Allene oxide cyclase barrel-like domain-containing protein n=1 Tax=Mycolicibacterium neworleansense TaxID=146018 RepID=A0A0H5RPY1_9MYCO|nr:MULTISPECIES: hypothetical protein [Mycolicibacterium]MCV7365039.1 hypothetical protein [Mycolicibacterium neworleansense]CRZ15841.1 hypothetical protein BN2156_02705 [Mycolicibacterium neworleansense]